MNFSNLGSPKFGGGNNQQLSIGGPKANVPVQKIFQAQILERRKKGLFYNCDSNWHYGHKCQNPKLFLIENEEVLDENIKGELEEEDLMEFSYGEENPKISLRAITGSQHPRTMRLVGWIGN